MKTIKSTDIIKLKAAGRNVRRVGQLSVVNADAKKESQTAPVSIAIPDLSRLLSAIEKLVAIGQPEIVVQPAKVNMPQPKVINEPVNNIVVESKGAYRYKIIRSDNGLIKEVIRTEIGAE